ncbi:MAG: ribosome-associated translation inhibitor RaiA [Actinobacteria bacterium]|nr:ribosome-associated translation inhibitor RaiA [Actinomycetota bacterium]
MQVIVKGKNIEVTDALRTHAEQKVAKIGKLGLDFKEIEVKLVVEKNPSIKDNQIAELTLVGGGPLLRATDRDRDMYVAIDKAVSKLLRRTKKFHGKQIDRTQAQESALRVPSPEEPPEEESQSIVKKKRISLKPMTPEEAVLQMEMLGHDFFVFTDSETDQATVVYKRNDGNFGLIDTSG